MSARSRDLPRRSCLSTPGSNEKFLAKAPTVPADMTFLDLEDAVAPLEKEGARPKVVDAIKNLPWDDRVLCVRVNAWDTEWTYGDVIEVVGNAGERLDEIMLPKVQSAAEVVALDLLLTQVEKKSGLPVGHIGIEAQIETARGLINVDDICAASPRLETIIFGPADFAASIEMPVLTGGIEIPEYPGDHFHYVFSRILMAGRANGLQVIDGPFLKVRELDALRTYAMRTRMLGYDGKWALTPDQAVVLNEVYSPTQEQFDRAFDILEAYEKATEQDRRGAVMFGDEMIDEASRKMAVKFVSRGERAGSDAQSAAERRARRRCDCRGSADEAPRDHLECERLVRALEDGQHPRVDEVAAHREFLGVAHAAVDLHGLSRHPFGGAAHVGLDHGGLERPFATRHQPCHVVRALARRLNDDGHAPELRLRQLVVADRRPEHLALGGVGSGGLVGGLHHAERPRRRLQPAVLEPLHLEVEALAQTLVAADEVGLGHEPVLERQLVGVHAAVAERVDGAPLEASRREVGRAVGAPPPPA